MLVNTNISPPICEKKNCHVRQNGCKHCRLVLLLSQGLDPYVTKPEDMEQAKYDNAVEFFKKKYLKPQQKQVELVQLPICDICKDNETTNNKFGVNSCERCTKIFERGVKGKLLLIIFSFN